MNTLRDVQHIYIMCRSDHPWLKVGISMDSAARAANLSGAIGASVRVLYSRTFERCCDFSGVRSGHSARDIERLTHIALSPTRIGGEWFAATLPEIRSAIAASLRDLRNQRPAVIASSQLTKPWRRRVGSKRGKPIAVRMTQDLKTAIMRAAASSNITATEFVERHMRAIVMPKRKGRVA